MSKLNLITLLFLAFYFSSVVAETNEDSGVVNEKTVIAAIRGDTSAISELQKKDRSKVLDRLQRIVLSRDFDNSTMNGALEMIKTMPKSVDYFRDRIINDKSGGGDYSVHQAFEILAKMKTEESIKAVAEFLFDTSNPTYKPSGDIANPSPNREIAVVVLSEVGIQGAPTARVTYENKKSLVNDWKEWWLQKHSDK